ncbi:MAG: AMP-binding protein, partial [Paracoccaceae bacterium]|nr:AMP-binding protein [Paracoccaceae bacterium]
MTYAGIADRNAIENEMPWDQRDLPQTVYGLLSRTAKAHPNHPAVSYQLTSGPTDKAETLDWKTLHEKVTQAANLFRSLGIGENDTVAYVLPNCNETVHALLGGAVAGIVNPINP